MVDEHPVARYLFLDYEAEQTQRQPDYETMDRRPPDYVLLERAPYFRSALAASEENKIVRAAGSLPAPLYSPAHDSDQWLHSSLFWGVLVVFGIVLGGLAVFGIILFWLRGFRGSSVEEVEDAVEEVEDHVEDAAVEDHGVSNVDRVVQEHPAQIPKGLLLSATVALASAVLLLTLKYLMMNLRFAHPLFLVTVFFAVSLSSQTRPTHSP